MSTFGNFQADVGRVGSTLNLIFAYLFAPLFIIGGLGLLIWGATRRGLKPPVMTSSRVWREPRLVIPRPKRVSPIDSKPLLSEGP